MGFNNKIFEDLVKLEYKFVEEKNSSNLVVVFSGYSNHPEKKAIFNYINSLKDVNENKLFILDDLGYEGRGCWYIGENGTNNVAESVNRLILKIIKDYGINKENIILVGTSKGGFASIYFSLVYGYKNVIAGAPQIKLGNYLNNLNNKEILKSMVNKEIDLDKEINRLNELISNKGCDDKFNINIYCGLQDLHLKNHLEPFIIETYNKINNVNVQIIEGNHASIGTFFKDNLSTLVKNLINGEKITKKNNLIGEYQGEISCKLIDKCTTDSIIAITRNSKTIDVKVGLNGKNCHLHIILLKMEKLK